MAISDKNRRLLERRLGRALPDEGQKVTLTVAALASIVESARLEGIESRARANDAVSKLYEATFGRTA